MSYNVTLGCSCRVYVSVDPRTEVAHTRVIEERGAPTECDEQISGRNAT